MNGLLIVYPGFRLYNYSLFEQINNELPGSHVIFIRSVSDETLEKLKSDFNDTLFESVNMRGIRVNDYTIIGIIRLILFLRRRIKTCKLVISSTQAPFHTKIAFVLSKLYSKKFAVIVEQWRDSKNKNLLFSLYKKLGLSIIKRSSAVFCHGQRQKVWISKYRKDPAIIWPFYTKNY